MFWILYLANYLVFQFFSYSWVEKKIFILLTLLCLYEIQWHSYQPFFFEDMLSVIVPIGTIWWESLMEELDLKWA